MLGNTSLTSNYVQIALYMVLLDELLQTPREERVDWSARYAASIEEGRREREGVRERLYPELPEETFPPTLGIEGYAGRYWHPAYRELELVVREEGLLIADRYHMEIAMKIELQHVSGEFWLATMQIRHQFDPRDWEVVRAEFRVSAAGKAVAVGIEMEPEMGREMIWFDRVEE